MRLRLGIIRCAAKRVTSINARLTHCRRGHEFSEANTRITAKRYRVCIECANQRNREYYAMQHRPEGEGSR